MTGTWSHEHKATLAATPESVFAALTTPVALRRWFADEVEIEPKEGGSFRFWGKHAYPGTGPEKARQRVTRWIPNEALGFTWPIDGAETTVEIMLTPKTDDTGAPPSTVLLLRHTSPTPLEPDLISDLWKLGMGNLGAYLEGGDGIVLPDYTDPNPEIRLTIVIDAPRERVFRALVDPEAMTRWLGAPKPVVEPRAGGAYSYGWEYKVDGRDVVGGPTTILDYVENERLVTDWPDWRGDMSKPRTRVAWHLESIGEGKTKVTLVHGDFPRAVDMSDYPFGWGWFLSQLKGEVVKA